MKFTGERVVIDDMKEYVGVLQSHIARYNFALSFVNNKTVLDAACGTGYGSDLMSNVAKKVYGCDINRESIVSANETYRNMFFVEDLNNPTDIRGYDVITSFETIEHLTEPDNFLKWAGDHCRTFICSMPISSPSQFHKQVWNSKEIKFVLNKYFSPVEFYIQYGLNFYNLTTDPDSGYIIGVGQGKLK